MKEKEKIPLCANWTVDMSIQTCLPCAREMRSRPHVTQHSVIACSSDMFDIRSNIRRQYDQIFQTYLTIANDDPAKLCSVCTNNSRTMFRPHPCTATVIAALRQRRSSSTRSYASSFLHRIEMICCIGSRSLFSVRAKHTRFSSVSSRSTL